MADADVPPHKGRRNTIAVLHTSGTHYEVGYDVGRTFSAMIKDFLATFEFFQQQLLPAYNTDEGRERYNASLDVAQDRFPQYVREIQGTADGAGVLFEHLMLLHIDRLMVPALGISGSTSHGCSSVCCNYEGQVLLGHTEDALGEVLNHIYIVSATISEDEPQGRYKKKRECFTAFCYAGYLPGYCMGYNDCGFVFSINILFPSTILPGKSAPYFLTRALLAASTLEEAQDILRDTGVGAGDGFSVNMFFSRQEGEVLFHNVEVAPAVGSSESQLSTLAIGPGEYSLHTNKYLRLSVPENTVFDDTSSTHRHHRLEDCSRPTCRDSLVSLLSDTHDKKYPFFREGQTDNVITVAVGVFDLLEKTWTLWMKNPKTTEPVATLPLTFSRQGGGHEK